MEGDDSASDRRRGDRGSSKMPELTKLRAKGKRMRLELNSNDNFIGNDKEIANFSSYLGACVRSHIPINIVNWKSVDNTYKEKLWDDLTSVFDFDERILTKEAVFSKASKLWTGYKSNLYCSHVHGKKKGQDPCIKNTWLRREVWEDFVRQRSTKEAEAKRKKAQDAAKSDLIPHTTSRGGVRKVKNKMIMDKFEEMKQQMEEEGHDSSSLTVDQVPEPYRDQVWKNTKISTKKGDYVNTTCKKIGDEIDRLSEQRSQGLYVDKEGTDLLGVVYPIPEHPDRVRATGFGVGIKQFFGTSSKRRNTNSNMSQQDVEALLQSQLQSKILPAIAKASEDTKRDLYRTLVDVVSDPTQPLTEAKLGEVFGIPAESSHMTPNEIRSDKASCDPAPSYDVEDGEMLCKFNIIDEGEIVPVAEGVVTSSQILHGKTLPNDQVRVRVDKVIERYATLPVRDEYDNSIVLVHHAKGTYVAWPKDLCQPLTRPRKQTDELFLGKSVDRHVRDLEKLSHFCTSCQHEDINEIEVSDDVFGIDCSLSFSKEEIADFLSDKMLDSCWVQLFMSYLHEDSISSSKFTYGFVSPFFTSSFETRRKRVEYLGRTLSVFKRRTIFFNPIVRSGHWYLVVICPRRSATYVFDSVKGTNYDIVKGEITNAFSEYLMNGGRCMKPDKELEWLECDCPQQLGSTECGYYVMRLMYDLIRGDVKDDNISTIITSLEPYSKQDLEEIKEILARFFLRYMAQN